MATKRFGDTFKFGLLGGGQLGRMMIQEAINYDIQIHSIDPDPEAPCSKIAHSFQVGSLLDYDTVYQFGKDKDVLSIEIENVNTEALIQLQKEGVSVFPQPEIIALIQDKGLQKLFYQENQIPSSPFILVNSKAELSQYIDKIPFALKLRRGGYDGKGVQIIRKESDLATAFDAPCIIEELVDFEKELSVIVARNQKGQCKTFPSVECEFNPDANLVEFLFAPAAISDEIEEQAQKIAMDLIKHLDMVGLLAVEFFLTKSGELLVNEVAPRPHNSGHHTIECNQTSQFEQHLRSVLDLPLGDTSILQAGAMINLLGEDSFQGKAIYEGLEEIMEIEGVHVHIYGKQETKSFRKMGHVTIAGKELAWVKETSLRVKDIIKVKA